MIQEVALVTASAVLFVQTGLSEAIQDTLHVHSRIASCPKCATFWSVLSWCLLTGCPVLHSIAASFISSYCAIWLSLIYDALAKFYNSCYDALSETGTSDPAEGAETDSAPDAPSCNPDEVSKL